MMNPDPPADEIDAYSRLDLDALKVQLMSKVGQEARSPSIDLTTADDQSSACEGLTPCCAQWFNSNVAETRTRALSRITAQARGIRLDGEDQGIFEKIEIANAELRHAQDVVKASNSFATRYSRPIRELREKDDEYRRHKNEQNGREPKVTSNWLMFGGLFPLVLIPESLLNFQSFRKAPIIQSDFMALGVTLLVAIGIAVAAHFVGVFIRQHNYYRHADDTRSNRGTPMLWIGLSILLACIVVVAVARYYYLVPQFQQAVVLGLRPPNMAMSVGSLLFGNIICFLLGAAFAWWLHDDNPEYEDTERTRRKLVKRLDRLRHSELIPQIAHANRILKAARDRASSRSRAMQSRPGYIDLNSNFEKIKSKDQNVASVLQDYKALLAQHLQERQAEFQFLMKDYSDPINPVKRISVSRFQNLPVTLHYANS